MHVLLFLTVSAVILISVGLIGMFISATKRINELEKSLNVVDKELTNHKRSIRILNEREAQKSDKVVVYHEWSQSGQTPKYPSQEGF